MTRLSRIFEPRAEHRQIYDALYRRVYLQMYSRLRPLYAAIQDITGYPAAPDIPIRKHGDLFVMD